MGDRHGDRAAADAGRFAEDRDWRRDFRGREDGRERARIAGTKGITEYGWAPNSKSILVPIDGDIYVAALDGNIRRLTSTAATEINAKVSETGRYVVPRDQNLFVMDAASGQERALTTDGGKTLSWGAAEFVAQEELGRDTGYWWSPGDRYSRWRGSTRARSRSCGARQSARRDVVIEQRYPSAGTRNAVVDLGVMTSDGKSRVKADLGTNPDIIWRGRWARTAAASTFGG